MKPGFTEFDTAVGRCGIAWGDRNITGVWLPGTRRVRQSVTPPPDVEKVIEAVTALLDGDRRDLSWVPLDMDGLPDFDRRVYEVARSIPPGSTVSYGDVAALLGSPHASRDVGRARSRRTRSRSSSRATESSAPVARSAASRPPEASPPRCSCSRSKARGPPRRASSTVKALRAIDGPKAVRALRRTDPVLGGLTKLVGPFALDVKHTSSVFSVLAEAIVYQQLTGRAAETIHGRVLAACAADGDGLTADHVLHASDETLRGAGLSRRRSPRSAISPRTTPRARFRRSVTSTPWTMKRSSNALSPCEASAGGRHTCS